MLKKIREFLKEKGQGVVEYALILGFVAVLAVALIGSSGLQTSSKNNIDHAQSVLSTIDYQFSTAGGSALPKGT